MRVSLTFRIERVIYIRFKLKNFVIAQTECAEAKRHPAQTIACRMRPDRMRVGGADNNEFSLPVDEFLDEPRTGNAVNFHFLAGDPFHDLLRLVNADFGVLPPALRQS